ncbi:SDR family NAD(P)-dependent oxidoreductase [Novosphingobium album (ex Liu et al. 2023)]|uniref:SDR family oxidoreductase n=1 Tax=Novosphingobium album (ex Liu et al. 2023) TaxID=3031130 RepID=A0ABT5WNL6_9SPHN|nr:SDR family oxidoreductase [Novosphingobium album (ex Liu et al. 2023)]MDE8651326.1 SDR family oxidoreductase [Novosphingobium album (ex Liu et al. 2023)]
MQRPYEDAIVCVTGASSGLGRAIATGAAGQGARAVIVNYAGNAEGAETTAEAVRAYGAQAVTVQGDVGTDEDCRRIVAAAAPFGRIDALFNNAGKTRAARYDDLDALGADDFLDIYRVNVVGPYQMTRAARPLLETSDRAAVVMISSIAGVTGGGSSIAYSASKGALNNLAFALARALAPRIRVNALCPGFMDSPWFDKLGSARARIREGIAQRTPLQVASTPEDIAGSALFLGSPASRHVTGETLLADAGLHLVGG